MKNIKLIITNIFLCILLTSCTISSSNNHTNDYFGFNTDDFEIIEENDTHGGFHGDGSYYITLDCTENADLAREIVKDWNNLPLSENLRLVMYGGDKNGMTYMYNFATEANWPYFKSGVYKFVDRHNQAINESNDSDLLNRFSFNFTLAVYDFDTDTFYYFEKDT